MCNCGMKSEHLVGTNIPRYNVYYLHYTYKSGHIG